MPVGTGATVKAMFPEDAAATGADILLANTYHLMLRPGAERIAKLGGLHRFMHWEKPILTDSGGYQVMSLAKLRRIGEEGVTFQSHIDGAEVSLSPERAIERNVCSAPNHSDGARRVHALSGHARGGAKFARPVAALGRAQQGRVRPSRQAGPSLVRHRASVYPDLRERSARALMAAGFDGYAIGGLAVGEGQAAMLDMVEVTAAVLPQDRPRYLMGVGTPEICCLRSRAASTCSIA